MGGKSKVELRLGPEWHGQGGPGRLGPVQGYISELVDEGFPSSVSVGVIADGSIVFEAFGGRACAVGDTVATTFGTLYDLASLTKVVCTVSLVMLAQQRGELTLADPVRQWLPGYPGAGTTLWHLLTHTSGLVDHRPFFATCKGPAEIRRAVFCEAEGAPPGGEVRYSDLNFMLLGWALENVTRQGLDKAFDAQVAMPLGLGSTLFCLSTADSRRSAATELEGDQRLTPGLIWGDVHDGNAFALGGVAGHAGLFAPLHDLCLFAQTLLGAAGPLFSAETLAMLSAPQATSDGDTRSIGWRLVPPAEWGQWPAGTLWHTGFTGTSMLVAPPLGVAVVLLTNAVHPHRDLPRQSEVRSKLHSLVASALR